MRALLAALLAGLALSAPAFGFEPSGGCLLAERACPAAPAIRALGEPGAAALVPGQAYPLLGANRPGREASHLQIRTPEGSALWVAAGCGRRVGRCPEGEAATVPVARPAPRHVLAASWQAAFCELNRRRPECRGEASGRPEAARFSLHGLWPESGEYCGVEAGLRGRDRPGAWRRLPAVELSPATKAALEAAMPGTRSGLERHEWLRHGTCYGAPPERYFRDALRLLGELNASPVRELFARRVGDRLTLAEIRAAFDAAFGPGIGRRVGVVCEGEGRGRLIVELRLELRGEIDEGTGLAGLMAAAPEAGEHCPSGRVGAPG